MANITGKPATSRAAIIKFLVLIGFLGAAWAVLRFSPAREWLDRERVAAALEQVRHIWWLPAPFLGLFTIACVLMAPASLFIIPAGAIFGPVWGSVWSLLGGYLTAIAAYWIGRLLGKELIERFLISRLGRWSGHLQQAGFVSVLSLRLLLLPFGLLNYACGAAGIPFLPYLAGTLLGIIPSFVVLAVFGDAFLQGAQGGGRGLITLAVCSALILALSLGTRALRSRVKD